MNLFEIGSIKKEHKFICVINDFLTNAYKWVRLCTIAYERKELLQFRNKWTITPFNGEEIGSFWFQVEFEKDSNIQHTPGIETAKIGGISPSVFRVSIRECDGYLGYLTTYFNVPGVFGSVPSQSNNYLGIDCVDALVAAFNVRVGLPDKDIAWDTVIKPGDFIAVRYPNARSYQHIGALYQDANGSKKLDADDLVLHAGPSPLHLSLMKHGYFDGHVCIIRPSGDL